MNANIGLWDRSNSEFKQQLVYRVDDINSDQKDNQYILTTKTHLIFYSESIYLPDNEILKDQLEVPLVALDWLIINFSRLPLPVNKGGYSDGRWSDSLYLSKEIDLSILYFLHHHFAEYCFTIKNNSSKSYINPVFKQEINLFRKTLIEHGVLAKLTEINDLYKEGKL